MKKIKDFQNKRNGITLVALVITIIIMLILAGITINLTIGENGIIKKAQQAGENYVNVAEYERYQVAELSNKAEEIINSDRDKINEKVITMNSSNFETLSGSVVTNNTPYDEETIVNSYTVSRAGMYYILGRAGYSANVEWTTGYVIYRIKINGKVVNTEQRNDIQYRYSGFNASYATFLNVGDVVDVTLHQNGITTTIALDYNLLNLNPIYYVEE